MPKVFQYLFKFQNPQPFVFIGKMMGFQIVRNDNRSIKTSELIFLPLKYSFQFHDSRAVNNGAA